jgi:capsular polysaccharide biosynthesis protein
MLQLAAPALGLVARVVQLGQQSFCEQVATMARAKVLIGAHGADLANAGTARSRLT